MKLSFSTLACPTWTLEQIVDAAVAAGVDGIDFRGLGKEIDITRLPLFDTDLPRVLELFREKNLVMPCFSTSVTLVSPAPDRWQMMLDECHRYASLASRTHTPFLRIFGGGVPKDMTRDEALAMAQRHLRQVVKICRQFSCLPLLETHDSWSTSEQVLTILHEFDPNEVGVLWDVEHPHHHGEAPADTANRLKRFIRYIHIKDSVPENDKSMPRLLGEGTLPLRDCLRALRDIGYNGWICLEAEKRWIAATPDPEVTIPQFATYMRRQQG